LQKYSVILTYFLFGKNSLYKKKINVEDKIERFEIYLKEVEKLSNGSSYKFSVSLYSCYCYAYISIKNNTPLTETIEVVDESDLDISKSSNSMDNDKTKQNKEEILKKKAKKKKEKIKKREVKNKREKVKID